MNATTSTQSPQAKPLEWLNRLRANPRLPLIVAASTAIAIVVALILWAKTTNYSVLFSNVSNEDGGAIITQLTQMNVPYRFADNGSAILVPEDKVYDLRLRLAQQGLPRGGAVGFELLDNEKFGISQFSEQINYQRALEGELARTIETLGPVKSARIHLAMPKPSLFVREQKSPSASVTLNLEPGRALDDGQINAIVHIVSSAVAGMPPGNVTIVDQAGHLLTRSDTSGRGLNDEQLKYASEVESRVQQRIEAILGPIVGSRNVHAQVSAQIDFNAKEQTQEQYGPNTNPAQQAIRSQQLNNNVQLGGSSVGGVPGALSNQPAPANSAPIATQNNAQNTQQAGQTGANAQTNAQNGQTASTNNQVVPSNTTHDETTNYEVDRTILHTKMNIGDIQRLSVAVVVNYKTAADGKSLPLTAEQLKQIEDLTREAMGYSAKRGDTVNVVNSPFTAPDNSADNIPFWKTPAFINQCLEAGRWLLIALIAWILWRKMVRPHVVRRQEAIKAAQERARQLEEEDKSVTVTLSKDEQQSQRRNNQRLSAEVMSQRIREMSDNDPRVVALVIRQWMGNEL
ncbi:flagellar M-ring protein FliF [Mangrovibacter phragmitis]|uniref:Flagellar M-ring protein n=1 Tax=Mangrovibacter phragmitis TaxID=1691903 RepID=A0A1B7L8M7_9ENTR|nr:flagellar basal-body MS-ring/collar protein FliF [Mangrovibacter phragmitis]OAT78635.1 flagellar M-ring protein FliF [Mangrovibacter phragmitis]